MKHYIVILVALNLVLPVHGQKSKVVAVKQMMDAGKFDEAKEAIEEALDNPRTSKWPRTYFTKGLLCQTAYIQGVEKNDSKKTSLYDDQLYVAYDAYEKALELDSKERLNSQISHNYYLLGNAFRQLGARNYEGKEYQEALRAFEHAILIGESDLISARADTNLIYNASMAAYESQNWKKANKYLSLLHEAAFSPATSLLLSESLLKAGDTIRSEEIMMQSLEQFRYRDTLVMYVVNHQVRQGQMETAIEVLDRAIESRPDYYRFHWAQALVYEEMDRYDEAVNSLLNASELSQDRPELYYHLGVLYYNIGIDMRESAFSISENSAYMEARKEYLAKFREAVRWLERSYELDPQNQKTIARLHQLYNQLQMKEKQESLPEQ
jgi:tetratricopeptide (TPR) repeat protein